MQIGLPTLLTIIFAVLKLCHVIAWSWWWVFSPLLIVFGLAAVIFVIGLVGAFIVKKTETPGDRAARALRNYGKSLR